MPLEALHQLVRFLFLLAACALLLPTGCATEQPITAPHFREQLVGRGPVAVVEPQVTVYREMPYETVLDRGKEQATARTVFATAGGLLAERGWPVVPVTDLDWAGFREGYSLAERPPAAPDPRSRLAAAVLRQLDQVGDRLRVHHRPEGIHQVETGVVVGDLQTLAPEADSFLFMSVTGCFGRVREGPCRTLQFPPSRYDFDGDFKNVLTVPFGMAIRFYWLDAGGTLLWYDDFTRHNLNPGSGEDVQVLVETGLAAFPSRP
jgi:hypothetical protein